MTGRVSVSVAVLVLLAAGCEGPASGARGERVRAILAQCTSFACVVDTDCAEVEVKNRCLMSCPYAVASGDREYCQRSLDQAEETICAGFDNKIAAVCMGVGVRCADGGCERRPFEEAVDAGD
jgi:hypothetical protein